MDCLIADSKELDIGLEKFVTSVYKEMLSDFPATVDTGSYTGTLADFTTHQ